MSYFKSLPLIYRQIIFGLLCAFCLTPWCTSPIALVLGIVMAYVMGHPFQQYNSKATQWLLKISVVGLGFGMQLTEAMKAGKEGIVFTVISISSTLVIGILLGKMMKVDNKTTYLIASGTAICGGSAIAAVSPIVKADDKQISIALGVVFLLNSVALLLFPFIGNMLHMTQHGFGLWSAIAIHDTSSVVAAATEYGKEALTTATTVKLERALWIIPLSVITALIYKTPGKAIKIPWFIGAFIIAMIISEYLPQQKEVWTWLAWLAKRGLTLTLFLIGAGLSVEKIKSVGVRPLLLAVVLWFFIAVLSISVIEFATL